MPVRDTVKWFYSSKGVSVVPWDSLPGIRCLVLIRLFCGTSALMLGRVQFAACDKDVDRGMSSCNMYLQVQCTYHQGKVCVRHCMAQGPCRDRGMIFFFQKLTEIWGLHRTLTAQQPNGRCAWGLALRARSPGSGFAVQAVRIVGISSPNGGGVAVLLYGGLTGQWPGRGHPPLHSPELSSQANLSVAFPCPRPPPALPLTPAFRAFPPPLQKMSHASAVMHPTPEFDETGSNPGSRNAWRSWALPCR